MSKNRGSISLVVLLGLFFLIAVMQVAVMALGQSLANEEEYLRERQLRLLGISAVKKFVHVDLEAGEKEVCRVKLYPGGGEASLVRKNLYSDDAYFRYFDINVVQGKISYWLRQTTFTPPQQVQALGEKFMFIYGDSFQGEENLNKESEIYASKEEVSFPKIAFLQRTKEKSPCRDKLDFSEVEKDGLGRMFYYIYDKPQSLHIKPYASVHGSAVIAAEKGIRIGESGKFFDRVILLAHGPCWIEDNVEMKNVFIMASGPVTIGTGCHINGVIFTSSNIILQGKSSFTHDASNVATFASAFSLL